MSMIETLRVPIGEYSNKSQSYSKLLSKALNQASLNDDGTQTDNERKVWDNLGSILRVRTKLHSVQ